MLKLNASYSKKIPVEGTDFSSQSFHAAVEVELPDGLTPEQLQGRIHGTFQLVKDAVENELHSAPAAIPAAPAPAAVPPPQSRSAGRGYGAVKPGGNNQPASGKQIQFLTDLALRRGLSLQQLQERVRQQYRADDITRLSRGQASELIDAFTDDGEARRAA